MTRWLLEEVGAARQMTVSFFLFEIFTAVTENSSLLGRVAV
jgi:hypothetical protein